jgi:hypothetical protein
VDARRVVASLLSLALVAPDAVRTSLLAKVDSAGRIIQDTGTGGSWPVSTDRVVWALAAWELYAATGDRAWLRQAYDVTRRSAEADLHAARDTTTGLFRGESSFLDWREQSYPRWMQPADIYQGQALGTNAAHLGAYRALARMARAPGRERGRRGALGPGGRRRRRGDAAAPLAAGPRVVRAVTLRAHRAGLSPRSEALGRGARRDHRRGDPRAARAADGGRARAGLRRADDWPSIPATSFYHNAAICRSSPPTGRGRRPTRGSTAAVEHGLATLVRTTALI